MIKLRLPAVFFVIMLAVGCGGDSGPSDDQFEIPDADVTLANEVRGYVEGVEAQGDAERIGGEMLENLEGVLENPAAAGHEETYKKILEAAGKLARGDASQFAEIKKLTETLPK